MLTSIKTLQQKYISPEKLGDGNGTMLRSSLPFSLLTCNILHVVSK